MSDFYAVLTADLLVAEVAGGAFAFKNKIKPNSIKALWEKLSIWIADVLKSQKVGEGSPIPCICNHASRRYCMLPHYRASPCTGSPTAQSREFQGGPDHWGEQKEDPSPVLAAGGAVWINLTGTAQVQHR